MTTILLPALPEPYYDTWPLTPDALRARDLEVARVVLEFLINRADNKRGFLMAPELRTIEVKHHE